MNTHKTDQEAQNDTSLTLPRQEQRRTRKPEEVAPLLGIGRNGVYALIKTGELRSIKVGRKILIPLSAVDEFLNRHDE